MKLSTKSRYAVMALADIARFKNNHPISLRDISIRQGISLVYLEQLFLKLKKNEIVKSIRGKKGGYTLNKTPDEIKISDILSAVEEKVKTIGCQKHSKKGCNGKSAKCITHNLWDELETHINVFFQEKKLGDLINKTENRL
ncbi:Rrf2 family transcriptional regulator [Candidatus Pelagibacter sp.]|nr:Rrf2 family transcriptional regulator [Candidatus Pelagibacter sp.]|tara:strand:- start:65 stop:487 length:423 start_codon:yes stop_codon:yes gene_type:complete